MSLSKAQRFCQIKFFNLDDIPGLDTFLADPTLSASSPPGGSSGEVSSASVTQQKYYGAACQERISAH